MAAAFEKEETIRAVEAIEKIGLRFGSTRGLSELLYCLVAVGIVKMAPEAWLWALALAFIRSCLGLLSYHTKPHIDQKAAGSGTPS